MTLIQYATQETKAGRFPSMLIVPGEYGTFWVESAEYETLDGACFNSREAAETARSEAIAKAARFIPA